MAKYDPIFKEFLNKIGPILLSRLFNVEVTFTKSLNVEIPIIEERYVDFLAQVNIDGSEQIIHLEFQARNLSDMYLRMLDYFVHIKKKYPKFLIQQAIIYHGEKSLTMQESFTNKTALSTLEYQYRVIDLKEHPSKEFMDDEEPELLILALLMKTESTSNTFRIILNKIAGQTSAEELNNYLSIIEILIQSRTELATLFKEKVKELGLEYNIEKTESYKIGVEKTLKINIINILKERFTENLDVVEKKVNKMTNLDLLNELHIKAVKIESIQKFSDLL